MLPQFLHDSTNQENEKKQKPALPFEHIAATHLQDCRINADKVDFLALLHKKRVRFGIIQQY